MKLFLLNNVAKTKYEMNKDKNRILQHKGTPYTDSKQLLVSDH